MEKWTRIFATRNTTEASIIQGMLEENAIPVQVMNKMDSSYLAFGDIELYVPEHMRVTATQLINGSMLN